MELGLRLGDASEPMKFLQENSTQEARRFTKIRKSSGLNLGMDLSLHQEMEKARETEDEENGEKEDDDHTSEGVGTGSDGDGDHGETSLQLNLLPFSPVPRQLISSHIDQSLPWSSDNGSSENDSSRNKGPPAARRLDVNRLPAAAEEASTANSEGSLFQMDFGNKREFEATGNERESFRASDDDDGNTRKKLRLSKQQSVFLEQSFKEHSTLNPKQKQALANQLNLRPRQIEVWFQNRRARTKLKQNEVDCEYLKRCCETLSDENTRLRKELQDLRALKTPNSSPFYMATTLTMCPSCERQRLASAPENGKLTDIDSTPTPNPTPFPLSTPRFYPWRN